MLKQMVAAILLAGLGAETMHKLTRTKPASAAPARPAEKEPSAQPRRPTSYGVNLTTLAFWSHDRALMNLMAGGEWHVISSAGWPMLDTARISGDGTIASLQPGERIGAPLSFPPAAHLHDVNVHCTFEGKGDVAAFNTRSFTVGRHVLDLVWPKGESVTFQIDRTDPTDPIRQIDCREAGADRAALFDPLFIESLRPYQAIRFQGWEEVNNNVPADWNRRILPTSPTQESTQGVAVEHMVALANQAGVDPWFTLPFNADDTYMTNFARYVHDHLDPKRKVYIEVGNETWNYLFGVASQVLKEGRDEHLDPDGNVARMDRYAERAVHVFKIWQAVYGADHDRMVRVLAGQAVWPDLLRLALDYKDTAHQVDAVAMAPYFGFDFLQKTKIDLNDTDALFRAMPAAVNDAAGFMREDKALADRYGLRLIAYEAGQHLTYDAGNDMVVGRLNRDPRMADIYRSYLAAWNREAGDLIMMFSNNAPIGPHSAWGLAEYPGQPMSETPKRRAVVEASAARR